MRYDHPQLRSLLSAEYVLGTLQGAARRRYERLLDRDSALRQHLAYWEARCAALGLRLAPVTPPRRVWAEIQRRLGHARPVARPALFDRLGFWQVMAAAAAVAAIALGLQLQRTPAPAALPAYVATWQDAGSRAAWLVTLDPARGRLRCKAVGQYPLPAGRSLELWLLVEGEAAPLSLGLLPTGGDMDMELKPAVAARLARATGLAVSLEPVGGSPTGQPTGAVLWQAPLLRS